MKLRKKYHEPKMLRRTAISSTNDGRNIPPTALAPYDEKTAPQGARPVHTHTTTHPILRRVLETPAAKPNHRIVQHKAISLTKDVRRHRRNAFRIRARCGLLEGCVSESS